MEKIFSKSELEELYSEVQRLSLDEKSLNILANILANFKKQNKIQVNLLTQIEQFSYYVKGAIIFLSRT
jgi:hypothetical protein